MSLASALERAASALPADADAIRPANGDPVRLLRALGDEGAARVLGWLLANDVEAGEELGRAFVDDQAGRGALVALEKQALPKPAQKALRRLLHVLRGRGVVVPAAAPATRVATLPEIEDDLVGAWISGLDPSGARFALLVEPMPGGGVRLFELVLDESRGIAECHVYTPSRSAARRFVRRAREARGLAVRAIAPGSVRALAARCAAVQPADRPLPRPFLEHRSNLCEARGAQTPGELAAAALGDEPSAAGERRVVELIREGRLGPWPPARMEPLATAAERLSEISKSQLVLNDAQRREQFDAVLREAGRAVWGGEAAPRTAALFAEGGWERWQEGAEADARACLGVARALRERPDAEHEALRALADRALGPIVARMQAAEAESPIARP